MIRKSKKNKPNKSLNEGFIYLKNVKSINTRQKQGWTDVLIAKLRFFTLKKKANRILIKYENKLRFLTKIFIIKKDIFSLIFSTNYQKFLYSTDVICLLIREEEKIIEKHFILNNFRF